MKLKKKQYKVLSDNSATKYEWEEPRIKIELLEDIIVYKKLRVHRFTDYICTMIIPKGSIIVCDSDFTGKSRTNKVGILSIGRYFEYDNYREVDFVPSVRHSRYDNINKTITYTVGKSLKAPLGKTLKTCASGIHFYLTVKEAMNHW